MPKAVIQEENMIHLLPSALQVIGPHSVMVDKIQKDNIIYTEI